MPLFTEHIARRLGLDRILDIENHHNFALRKFTK